MTRSLAVLVFVLPTLFALVSCGDSSAAPSASSSSSSTFINLSLPDEGWAQSVKFETGEDGIPVLTLDDVRFELRDAAAYLLDWEAIGMKGITVTGSMSYKTTTPVEGAFLAVSGKAVEIREGVLTWGDDSLGNVSAGDVVVVDAEGLHIQGR